MGGTIPTNDDAAERKDKQPTMEEDEWPCDTVTLSLNFSSKARVYGALAFAYAIADVCPPDIFLRDEFPPPPFVRPIFYPDLFRVVFCLYFTLPGSFHMEWDSFHMDYILIPYGMGFIPYGLYAHSIWTRIHSIWTGIHSIWTRIHSIWIPGGLLDTIHCRNGRCENKIILIPSNTIYFI